MQLQKSSSHTPSSRLNRYNVLGMTALSMGLLLYGCGENRVTQCNKFVTVANKTKDLVAPKDAASFTQLADKIEQIRTETQAIAVKDSQLKDLQTKLLSMYGDVSSALKAQAKALEAKDTNAQTKAKQDLETAAGKESDLVDSINTLCAK
jgi:septal ring factor EnvC (AmiA/AmiB activator)